MQRQSNFFRNFYPKNKVASHLTLILFQEKQKIAKKNPNENLILFTSDITEHQVLNLKIKTFKLI